jgi:hypothetical protein
VRGSELLKDNKRRYYVNTMGRDEGIQNPKSEPAPFQRQQKKICDEDPCTHDWSEFGLKYLESTTEYSVVLDTRRKCTRAYIRYFA